MKENTWGPKKKSPFDKDTDTDVKPEYAPKWPDEVKPVEPHVPAPVYPPYKPEPFKPYPHDPTKAAWESEAPTPVKTGNTFTVFPDAAYDAKVAAAAVRKNDPPKMDKQGWFNLVLAIAKAIAQLTSRGPGKVTQPELDDLHAKAQKLVDSHGAFNA